MNVKSSARYIIAWPKSTERIWKKGSVFNSSASASLESKTADHRARVYIGAQALCCRISQVENELYTVSELFLGRSCVLA